MEEKNIQFYCNYDDEGKFTEILTGERIIPVKKYMYHDVIDKRTELNIDKFCIKNGELVQCDDTTLTEIGVIRPTTEQELEDVKKQLATVQEQNALMQEQNALMQEQAAQTQEILQKLIDLGVIPPTQPPAEDPTTEPETPTEPTEEPTTETA